MFMLHDVIHEMDPSERFQYAQLLAYLASVDGEISRIEMAFYEQRLGATLLSPERKQQLRESMLQQLDLDAHLAKMQPRSIVDQLLNWTVKGFHWMQEGYNVLDY
jgi:hypothetical protein